MSETATAYAKRLFTPAEVAAELAPAVSEGELRRRARLRQIEYTQGSRRQILFTRAQIEALLQSMARPVQPKAASAVISPTQTPNYFGATERSHARSPAEVERVKTLFGA